MAHIHSMARQGRYQEVAACLADSSDVNALGGRWRSTPLLLATAEGHTEVVRLLLKAGADPNIPSRRDGTPLHAAASRGFIEIVGVLLEHGAEPNVVDRFKMTPAISAAMRNRQDIVDLLAQHGADLGFAGHQGRSAADWLDIGGIAGEARRMAETHGVRLPNPVTGELPMADDKEVTRTRKMMSDGLTPEEYAARHGRNILVWSGGVCRYEDPIIQTWAHRLFEILRSHKLMAECEERYLDGEEREKVREWRERQAKRDARRAKRTRYRPFGQNG